MILGRIYNSQSEGSAMVPIDQEAKRPAIKGRLFWVCAIGLGTLFFAVFWLFILLEFEPVISWFSRWLEK
jgi:hypothetical protein